MMTATETPVHCWLGPLEERVAAGQPLLLFFDFDGTLTPIVRHPSLAELGAAARTVLARLSRQANVTVAILSGRALDDLRSRIVLHTVRYAGSNGMEIDQPGDLWHDPAIGRTGESLSAARGALADVVRRYPGTWIESKPGCLSIHYRGLPPLSGICLRKDIVRTLDAHPDFRGRVVTQAIEVTPLTAANKGTAVERIWEAVRRETGKTPFPVYFGDAENDIEGMVATLALDGFTIGVGPEAPLVSAETLDTPESLIDLLSQLDQRLSKLQKFDSERALFLNSF
jgi:trehalose 6-phosphate phosphatase